VERKEHNEIAAICRDALIEKKIEIKKLPVIPWDNIVFTFCEGLDGTELDEKRIADMFIAVVRQDKRIQAILTPEEKELIDKNSDLVEEKKHS
jgi:hypothetical protein